MAIQSELSEAGYTLLLACSEYEPELELRQVHKFVERGVDGLILVGQAHHPDLEPLLARRAMPFVNTFIYDRETHGTCIGPDNHKALMMMTDYLADLGHVRFGVIAQSTRNNDRAERAARRRARCIGPARASRCALTISPWANGRSRKAAPCFAG